MKKSCLLTLALSALLLTGCSMPGGGGSGGPGGNQPFDPWDNLGGGGIVTGGEESSTGVEDYAPDSNADVDDSQTSTDDSASTVINLSALGTETLPTGVTYEGTTLTVAAAGVYTLTGTMTGNVVVTAAEQGDVQIVLDGVTISTPSDSIQAAMLFEKTDGKRILTVKEGTTNTLSDSVGDTDSNADSAGAALQAKKCSFTINGTGTLQLNGVGDNATGLKVKKELTVLGTTMVINAVNNGIKADEKILIYDANLTITAGGDGIKTDMDTDNETDALANAADQSAGYIYIENTSLNIHSGDDGVSANNYLYFKNDTDDLVQITTNGGAPNTVTETSSDAADGKAIKTGGITMTDETTGTETDYPATYAANYSLVIDGGRYEIDSNDDAITSKGNLVVAGGEIALASGDDGLHAEYLTKITGGDITISNCYEGVEGASVEITGGTIALTSVDDGINAANADLTGYQYYIYLSGGNITVNAQGDGIDSNGYVRMEGGTVIVYGPTNGGNAALDTDQGFLLNGGTLIALGAVGMVETPGSNSAQNYVSLTCSSTQSAGTNITVTDADAQTLVNVTPPKTYQSVIISCPSFTQGSTYTVTVGSTTYSATLSSIGTALGSNAQGGGAQGMMPGSPGGR